MVSNNFNQSITVTRKINSSKDRLWEFKIITEKELGIK